MDLKQKVNTHFILRIVLAALLLAAPFTIAAQRAAQLTAKGSVAQGGYRFWLYTPNNYSASTTKKSWPLVIFLHGASLCGNNMNRALNYGTIDAISMGRDVPAVVISPQNPGGSWSPRKLNDILNWAIANCDIDSTRVYVLGMSLGGYGTLDFAGTYPHRIAAAMALCGGCTLKNMDGLSDLPLWIMHGTADRAVALSQSTRVVDYLRKTGDIQRLRYDWLPGASHGALARMFYLPQTYDWLFAHRLTDPGRMVNRRVLITQNSLSQAYKGLSTGNRNGRHARLQN